MVSGEEAALTLKVGVGGSGGWKYRKSSCSLVLSSFAPTAMGFTGGFMASMVSWTDAARMSVASRCTAPLPSHGTSFGKRESVTIYM